LDAAQFVYWIQKSASSISSAAGEPEQGGITCSDPVLVFILILIFVAERF
jgi:hypothetical protein